MQDDETCVTVISQHYSILCAIKSENTATKIIYNIIKNNNHGSTALYGLGPPLSEVTRSLCICGSEGPAFQLDPDVSQETWVRNGRLNLAYGHYWFFFMPEGSFT
jgi:hypothetical protein